MFGNLDLDFHKDCKFRLYRCSLCDALGEIFGTTARLLTNNEIALCLAIADAYEKVPKVTKKKICPAFSIHYRLNSSNPLLLFSSAITIILAHEKHIDDIHDGDVAYIKIIAKKLKKWRLQAEEIIKQMGFKTEPIIFAFQNQREIENSGTNDLKLLSQQTASVIGDICLNLTTLLNRPSLKDNFYNIGKGIGRIIYILDAIIDINKDRSSGAFNPFICNINGEKSKNTPLSEIIADAFPILKETHQELIRVVLQLPKNEYINELIINRLGRKIELLKDPELKYFKESFLSTLCRRITEISPFALLGTPRIALASGGGSGVEKCAESTIFCILVFFLYVKICRGICRIRNINPRPHSVNRGCNCERTYKKEPYSNKYSNNRYC